MMEIMFKNGDIVTREVEHLPEPELQVPDIRRDLARGKNYQRRLIEEEDRLAEDWPIVKAMNNGAMMLVCVLLGMMMAMVKW